MKTLKDSIDIWVVDNPNVSMGISQTVYISIPDTSSTCANISDLPALPSGWAYHCTTEANLQNTDGTGWIPLNLSSIYGGSPIPYFPIDPSNEASSGKYYTYTSGGSYELTALMESEKHFAMKDGGRYVEMFEAGSNLSLLPVSRDPSLVGYWPFEGYGSIADLQTSGLEDYSGYGNNGTADNTNGLGMSFVSGKVGSAVQFDGVDDYVNGGTPTLLTTTDDFSISVWVNPGIIENWSALVGLVSNSNIRRSLYFSHSSTPMYYTTFSDDNYSTFYGTPEGLIVGSWIHIVLTYDYSSKTYKFYQNGSCTKTIKRSLPEKIDSNAVLIGRIDNHYGDCSIDEVRIYNRALSETEINAIYETAK
ncbi:MAG: LamG domain-containing protein [Candidatus Colwellbacteria bacterium]|nr:LamG domain-containing protein [Candidatus Colwellbacteria bacterium]